MNRPEVHNAFDVTLRDGLYETLGMAADDPELAGIVITGAGPSFGAGGDLREFSMDPQPWRAKRVRRERDVWRRLLRFPGITVAAVHGNVAGSGLELAMYCDVRLTTRGSRWLLPETANGMIPGAGGTQLLPRLAGLGRALELMLLERELSGEAAHDLGIAAGLLPEQGRDAAAAQWLLSCAGLQSCASLAGLALPEGRARLRRLKALKTLLWQGMDMPLAQGLALESLRNPETLES